MMETLTITKTSGYEGGGGNINQSKGQKSKGVTSAVEHE